MPVKVARKLPFLTLSNKRKNARHAFFSRILEHWCSVAVHLTLPHVLVLAST